MRWIMRALIPACLCGCSNGGDTHDGAQPFEMDAGISCSDRAPCRAGVCCAGSCTDLAHDPRNCGACGVVCGDARFCTGQACSDVGFPHLCANAGASVVLDGTGPDDDAGRAIGAALAGACTETRVAYGGASSTELVGADGRPLTGPGATMIAAGGPFFQPPVRFMESGVTSVFTQTTSNGARMQIVLRRTGAPLADVGVGDLTAQHDWFVVQLALEPQSGSLVLSAYGLYPAGTAAAAYWTKTELFAKLTSTTDLFFVYEYKDTDGVSGPSAGDAFIKIASGS